MQLSRCAIIALVSIFSLFTFVESAFSSNTSVIEVKEANSSVIERDLAEIYPAILTGLRIEKPDESVAYDEDGVTIVLAGALVTVRIFGLRLKEESQFRIVSGALERGESCNDLPFIANVNVERDSLSAYSAIIKLRLPSLQELNDEGRKVAFHVCSLSRHNGYNEWIHQGTEAALKLRTFEPSLPLWLSVVLLIVLLSLSGLFSGLNLGLMTLDRTELKIYENTGSDREKRYARAISPVRERGNYLLCTLVLGNVLVNSSVTILLDGLTSGVIAVVGSTMGIVIFGEILPQAICSRHGMAIGAHTVWITRIFMLLTWPLSYPISWVLDKILGEEIGAYYNRERLKELIKVTKEYHGLEKEEVNVISGVLELCRQTAGKIMTRLGDVFMLNYDAVLDFETVAEIVKQGFSRIPVYEGERGNIVALLFIKELVLIDPADAIPLKTLCKYYQNECNFVLEDTTLDIMFREFKKGIKGHMAFVQRINYSEGGEPYMQTVGIVTLEDILEEMIQSEIMDEADVLSNNGDKECGEKVKALQDLSYFAMQYPEQTTISPQLALAAFQFLTTMMEAFTSEHVSETVLRRLLQEDVVIRSIRFKDANRSNFDQDALIYQQGKAADYFVLILEGRVEVTIGKENLLFESGPFTHFGYQALTSVINNYPGEGESQIQILPHAQAIEPSPAIQSSGLDCPLRGSCFISEYTVRALTSVVLFRLSRPLYEAAVSATQLEYNHKNVECKQVLDRAITLEKSSQLPICSARLHSIGETIITVPAFNDINVAASLHDTLNNGLANPNFVTDENFERNIR